VTARRALVRALGSARARAALVRAPSGEYLVAAARSTGGMFLAAVPTDAPRGAAGGAPAAVARVREVAGCRAALEAGGACEVVP